MQKGEVLNQMIAKEVFFNMADAPQSAVGPQFSEILSAGWLLTKVAYYA